MSSDERLRALERSGDRQAYLRECWMVGGREMFEAALRPGDEVEVDSYFADRRYAAVEPGRPAVVIEKAPMHGRIAGPSVRTDWEWEVECEQTRAKGDPAGTLPLTRYMVSWLRPRGLVPRGHGG